MNKLLLFVLVMLAVYWGRRAFSKPAARSGKDPAAGRAGRAAEPEKMLACVHCGIHVPESEGVRDDHDFYCCAEHRRLHHSRH
ncbi:PP0621 family protein [Cognatazoarcus halotolerans]|uniref:PP0621 family protein n=1 Tax=Cognatazoarcus halotolerans TaxID=2686016 RepID=UPI001359ADC0|nr:PP0621 family protein [Cognatazoarcus halotolerans]MBX3679877.1 hypothetical protein [Rhodocyclaceae bacterium]MCB1899055.1 hypothetical protein [Rhodocyclaceae bacterium]MCP5308073.1 hypothetical protein [Zoogloeaceae bacterium]